MLEKRLLTRVSYAAPGWLGCRGGESVPCETVNISLNGILAQFYAAPPFMPGDHVHVIIVSGEWADPVEIDCVVARAERNTAALRFHAIDGDALLQLKQSVETVFGDGGRIEDEFLHFITGIQNETEMDE